MQNKNHLIYLTIAAGYTNVNDKAASKPAGFSDISPPCNLYKFFSTRFRCAYTI